MRRKKEGLLTERGRAGTLSPQTNNDANNKRISSGLNFNSARDKSAKIDWNFKEEPFIEQWSDYTNKYGMGYTLTNGSMGVYFNDNTKISLAPDNFSIEYIIKNESKQELKN